MANDLPVPIDIQTVEEPALPLTNGDLLALMLEQYLRGHRSAVTITKALHLPREYSRITSLLKSASFQREIHKAKRDISAATVDIIKRHLPEYFREMHDIAINSTDVRSKVDALKDLMNRGGTAPTQKLAHSTPKAYKDMLAELMDVPVTAEPEPEADMEEPTA